MNIWAPILVVQIRDVCGVFVALVTDHDTSRTTQIIFVIGVWLVTFTNIVTMIHPTVFGVPNITALTPCRVKVDAPSVAAHL